MTTVLFRFFVGIWENHFGLAIFPKKLFWFWILKKKIWLDRRKKLIPTWHFHSIIIYLPFSQYNHIQNFEEKKLFQHFVNLIKIRSTHLFPILDLIIPPLPEGGGGVYCFTSVRPSFQNIFRHIFLSNYWWQKSDIWSQASHGYAISWEAFLEPSDSYFLFADLVGFYPHWTYMHIFLNNYWWQKYGIWSQASYKVPHIMGSGRGIISEH
jgi:hypothetical protein